MNPAAQLDVDSTPIITVHDGAAAMRPRGVRVRALGPLRLGFGRLPIESLGGPKAGKNQALGLFAFMFDRGNRGVEKDEAVELIWPDVSMSAADTAFHRTLLGLRGSLRAGGFGDALDLRNGRYSLASGLVSWSDVWEVERLITSSASTPDPRARIELLESCRQLNSADYMDDCPFYGTSLYVEPRRVMLRSVREAVLLDLAELYADSGHRALGAVRRAEAQAVSEATEHDA